MANNTPHSMVGISKRTVTHIANKRLRPDGATRKNNPDKFESKQVELDRRRSDPEHFNQQLCRSFPQLRGKALSLFTFSRNTQSYLPFSPRAEDRVCERTRYKTSTHLYVTEANQGENQRELGPGQNDPQEGTSHHHTIDDMEPENSNMSASIAQENDGNQPDAGAGDTTGNEELPDGSHETADGRDWEPVLLNCIVKNLLDNPKITNDLDDLREKLFTSSFDGMQAEYGVQYFQCCRPFMLAFVKALLINNQDHNYIAGAGQDAAERETMKVLAMIRANDCSE